MFSYLDFYCYFEANGQNHIHFWPMQVLKNSMAWHFLTFRSFQITNLYIPRDLLESEEKLLIFSSSLTLGWVKGSWIPIPKLTIVLIWKTLTCLKFGKTSYRAVENFPQRKLWVWVANAEGCTLSAKNLIPPNFGQRRQIFALSSSDPINYEVRLLRVGEWLICISLSLQ